MRTGFRNHGYYGHTFVGARLLSAIALLALIGLVAGFTSQINKASLAPPVQLTGAIIVSAAALLWVLLSFTAYDDTHIPYMATAIVDTVFLIPFVIVVIVLGGQLSQTECSTLPEAGNGTTLQLDPADSAGNGTLSYDTFIATDRMTCYKLQGTWGLSIALGILFLLSALAAAFLFMGKRKNGYKGKFFGKNSARFGKGKPIKGYKSPETWTSQNVNGTRSAGPASPKESKKSKQKKQKNGQNQNSSYDKGYSFFKPSTWYSSENASANSSSSTSRGVNNAGSSANSVSAQNVNMNNQAPHSTPSKNNTEPQFGSKETPGKGYFGFGRLWRNGGGRRDGRDRSKNTAPPGHQQEDIVLTDVPQGRRNDPNTNNSNSNRDLGGPQGESKGMGFLGLFRSKDKSRDYSSNSPHTNRSLDPQGRPQQPFPPNSNQAASSAGPLQGVSDDDTNMPGKRQIHPAPNGRSNGRPGPNTAGKGQPPLAGASSSRGPIPNSINNTKAGVSGVPPPRKGGPIPPLNQGPNVPSAAPNGKNNLGIANMNNPKANPNIKGKNQAGGPGDRLAAGATIGNIKDGARVMGFQRTPEPSLNPGANGQTLQRKQTGEIKPPMPGQPLPNRTVQPVKPVVTAPMAKNEPSSMFKGGLFSGMKNPVRKGNEVLPGSSTQNVPNKQSEGRGPLMLDPRNAGKPAPGTNVAVQQNLAPFKNSGQVNESRGFLSSKGKKGAAPPRNGAQPQGQREPNEHESSYRDLPQSDAAAAAEGRGKTRAEKKGGMESKPVAKELPGKQPPMTSSQKNSFESAHATGAPAFAAGNAPLNKQAMQQTGPGRSGPPAAQAGLPPHNAPQPERDARGRLVPGDQLRPAHIGSDTKPHPSGQPIAGSLLPGQSAKGQGPRAGDLLGPAQGTKGGLPPRAVNGPPAPPPVGRGPPGGQQPIPDERGRPLPQRAVGGPPGGSVMPASLAPGQPPQGPPPRFDARGQPLLPQRAGQPDLLGASVPGVKNTREPPNMPNEPRQPILPARDERGRPKPEPAVSNALAPGHNPRDDRGRPAPQKPGVQGREIPNALLPGGRISQESARGADGPNDRNPKPINTSGRPLPPATESSNLPPRNVPEQGRPMPPAPARAPNEALPLPPSMRDLAMAKTSSPSRVHNGAEERPLVSKDGRPITPFPEKPQPPHMGGERGRQMPPPGVANGQPPQPPPFLRDPSARGEASASQGVLPVPVQDQPSSRHGRTMPTGRPIPPTGPVETASAARDRSISRPPPMLLRDRMSKVQPNKPAQDADSVPMPPMPPSSRDGTRNVPSESATLESLRPGRGNENDGARVPFPPTNGQGLPPRQPGLAGFGAPPRDGAARFDERNIPGLSKAPINPWEKKPAANNIPGPFDNSFNEPRQLRSDPRDTQGPHGPQDMGQPLPPMGVKADGRGGQAPSFPSRDEQMNDKANSAPSRGMDVGKLDTNVRGRNTPSAEPTSATESPSKRRLLDRLFGKKDKKQAESSAKRPSLLPPGTERKSVDSVASAIAAGVVQPDQSGRTLFSQPQEVRPDQQSRDVSRAPNGPPPFQPGVDGPHKSLANSSIPHSRDGQQHLPLEPPFRESRARAPVFPTRPDQKPWAATDLNDIHSAAAASRDLKSDQQDLPKIPGPEKQKKMNRKSHMLAGKMQPMPVQDDAMPVPAVPPTPAAYKKDDEFSVTPGDTQMPPVPVSDDKQRRAANRKSHMNGFGPADIQMPPVPSLPEQAPAHKDDFSVTSDLPPSLRPGMPDRMPQGQRDLAGEPAKDRPGMVPPPPMGPKRGPGLPSRPMPRGAVKESASTIDSGLPPTGPEMERSDSLQDSQLPPSLRPGRPDLKLNAKDGELAEPLAKSRDMQSKLMSMPDNPRAKKSKGGRNNEQAREPLSPLDGNTSPRSPLGMELGNMPPSSQKPSSPSKLKDLFGKTKGNGSASREIGSPSMGSAKPLSPTTRLADMEKELKDLDDLAFTRKQQYKHDSNDSILNDGKANASLSSEFALDKGLSRKDVSGQTLKDAPREFADGNGRLDSTPFSSLAHDDKTSRKNKSRGLPGDKQDGSAIKKEPKRDFLSGGLFDGKDQMSPLGSPTFKDDEPWVAGKDTKAFGDKKHGFFGIGGDSKDKKQSDGSRGFMSGSPIMDQPPRSPGQGETWSTNEDLVDEKSSGGKKTRALFGRDKDNTQAGSKSPTDEKRGFFGLGKDKRRNGGDEFQSGSPARSPTMRDGPLIETWAEDEALAGEQKPGEKKAGLFSSLGKGKDKKTASGSPLGSPTWMDSQAVSPGLESPSMREDGVPGSKDKGTGLFSSFEDKKQRRGDRDSKPLDSADGEFDENAPGEKKSGLKDIFSKDKDVKNRGSSSGSPPPGKQGSALGSPTNMDEHHAGDNNDVVIPALLFLQQGRSQPASPVLPGQKEPGQFEGHPIDDENDEHFSSLSEVDKKGKKGKGLFDFGKGKNKNKNEEASPSPQVEPLVSPGFGQNDKRGKHRDSTLSNPDDIYTDQYGRRFSPQPESPTSPDMGKKDKKGKGFFERFGKNKDGEMTPTSMDGFDDHASQPLSPPRDDFPMSPNAGKKDKDGKGIFGWGKKDRDSRLASPLGDDFNHGGLSPRSPVFDERQSRDMDVYPAMVAESPMMEDSMPSPRRSFDNANSPPLAPYEEPVSGGQPEKMKPAPLNFKNKMRDFFDKVAGVDGEERVDDKRRSSRDFGSAYGGPSTPTPGGMDEYSSNNMPPSPAGMNEFGGNNSIPPSPAGDFGRNSMPPSPGGIDNFGGNNMPPSPIGGNNFPGSPIRDMDNFGGSSMPPSPSGMGVGAALMPMESPVQSPGRSDFDGMPAQSFPASPQPDMGMPSPAHSEAPIPFNEPEPIAMDSAFVQTPPASPPAPFDSRGMEPPMESPFMDNSEPADMGPPISPMRDDFGGAPSPGPGYMSPMADDFAGAPSPGPGYSSPPPMADNFGGGMDPADNFVSDRGAPEGSFEPEPAFIDDFGGAPSPGPGYMSPMVDDFGGAPSPGAGYSSPPPMADTFGGESPLFDNATPFGDAPPPPFDDGGDSFGNDGFDDGGDRGLDGSFDGPPMPNDDFPPENFPQDDFPQDDFPQDDFPQDDFPPEEPMMDDMGGDGERGLDDGMMDDEFIDGPGEDPPFEDPPFEDPPFEDPPFEDPPFEDPPFEDPPFEDPPLDDPPFEGEPPFEDRGLDDGMMNDAMMDDGMMGDEFMDGPVDEMPFEEPPFEEPPFEEPPFDDPPLDGPFDEEPPFDGEPFGEEPPMDEEPFDGHFDEEPPLDEGMMDGEFMDDMEGDRGLDDDMMDGEGMMDEEFMDDMEGDRGLDDDMMDGEEVPEEMMGDAFGEGEMKGDEFPEDIPEDGFPDEGEGEEDRGLDEELLEDVIEDGEFDGEGMENEEGGEFDGEGEESEAGEGLDDDDLQDIMGDSAPGSPIGSDNERGLDSPGMDEQFQEQNEEEQEGEAEADEQTDEPEDTNEIRMSQLYRQSAVMFSPVLTSPLPPSPPPEQDTASPQDEELESTDPIRFSHLYRQSVDLDMALTIQSPNSDGGLPAIAESPNMEQGQTFDVPVMAPVPDFAKRRSERMSARMSTMSQQLSPIPASPLSPRPLATPPPEEDETYDDEAGQRQYDPNYDVERAMSPEEEYENYFDEDDEYEPHEQRASGPGGPQTFDDMNLSPRPGPSPSERYSYHEDLEQGPPTTPFTPNGNRKTLRERMSGWWAQGNGNEQQGSGQPRTPPPPMPYDNGQFI